jgi:hypothetical protein
VAGVAGADAGVEAVAAGQEAGSAAHWAATDLGGRLKVFLKTRVFVQRTGQASLIQKMFNNQHRMN